mgnify:CR=1 FL=1
MLAQWHKGEVAAARAVWWWSWRSDGGRWRSRDEPGGDSGSCRRSPCADTELGADAGDMIFDRAHAEEEGFGDGGVRLPHHEQPQDFHFPRGQDHAGRARGGTPDSGQASGFGLGNEFHRIADRQDGFGGVSGDFHAEFFFESHHEFNRVQAVRAEIIDEAGLIDDLFRIDVEVFDYDLADAISDIAHI